MNAEEIPKIERWETYKILNKIKENVQQKKKIAKEVFVQSIIIIKFIANNFRIFFQLAALLNKVSMFMQIK